MRKLFSLIAAVLFAGSMMAAEVVFTNADFAGQGTANTGSEVSAVKDGVTFTYSKGYSAEESLRCYAHGALSITAEVTIEKINFTTTGGKTGGLDAEVEVGATKYEVADLPSQARFTEIKVTLEGEEEDPDEVVIYDWRGKIGSTILGAAGVEETTVKIHTNTDEVPAIKFSSSFVYADGKWIAIKPAEGGFKAGDVLYMAAVFNNADDTKYAQVDLRAADGDTRIWLSDSASTINGRTSAADPIVQTYKLEADQDSLFLGRYGNTGMFVLTLMVGRPEVEPQPVMDYYVVGTMTDWKANADYKLKANPAAEGEFMGEFAFKANDGFKVAYSDGETIANDAWFPDGMENEYKITEDGDYAVYFRPDGQGGEGWHYGFIYVAKKEAPVVPTTCAEAREAVLALEDNAFLLDGAEITLEGYVTEIATAWSSSYKNISFWMADEKDGGQVLEAFRAACETEADAPAVGDKVKVTGKLKKYVKDGVATPEFDAKCTFEIIEKAVPVDENEVVKLGFNLPTENRPADNSIEIAGSFVEGTMALEKVEATGWFLSYDFVKAVADDTFKLRDKSNNDLILCKYNEGKAIWEQAIFTFGDYWQDDTWKGTPCKLIEEDLSNAAEYAWKEGAPEPSEELADPTNCAEAAEAALSVSENNELYNGGKEYTIEGYVTEIQTAYSDQYHNITFWMADEKDGGKVLEAYRAACASAEDAVRVGDKVKVTGALTKYNTTPEFAAGCTYEIIERGEQPDPQNLGEKTIAEFLELKNKIDTCILTGAIDSVVNTLYGNFYLKDATATVYVYGLLNAAGEAKKCFEEEGLQVGDIITIKAIYNEYNNNPQVKDAIFVRKKGQGIDNTSVEIKVEKFFRDGQLIIRKNGIEYNVQGAVIK